MPDSGTIDERVVSLIILIGFLSTLFIVVIESLGLYKEESFSTVNSVEKHQLIGLSKYVFSVVEVSFHSSLKDKRVHCMPSGMIDESSLQYKAQVREGELSGLVVRLENDSGSAYLMARPSIVISSIFAAFWVFRWWRGNSINFIGAFIQGYTCIWLWGLMLC